MAVKKFCDDCSAEIDINAESKAEFDLKLRGPGGEYTRRVSVEIDFGNAELCESCIWNNANMAGSQGVKTLERDPETGSIKKKRGQK